MSSAKRWAFILEDLKEYMFDLIEEIKEGHYKHICYHG